MKYEERCKGCLYLGKLGSEYICDYISMTGIPREIPREECYKHEGTPYKKSRGKRKPRPIIVPKG